MAEEAADRAAQGAARRVAWDLYSKLVVTAGLGETLRHAGVDLDAGALRPRPTDLAATARRADLVFATADGAAVVHVEIQQQPDPDIGRRMLGYATRLVESDDYAPRLRRLVQIVVQVTGQRPMDTRFQMDWLSNSASLVHVPTIPVDDLIATPGLAPFAMVRGGHDVVPAVVRRIAEVRGLELQIAMVALSLALDPASDPVIMDELRRHDMSEVLDEYAVLRELRKTWWGEEVREEGRTEGRTEAVAEVLHARFPDASQAAVDTTARRLVGADAAAAIRAALALDLLDAVAPADAQP